MLSKQKGENKMNYLKKIDIIAFKVAVDNVQEMMEKEGYYISKRMISKALNKIGDATIELNNLDKDNKGLLLMYLLKT